MRGPKKLKIFNFYTPLGLLIFNQKKRSALMEMDMQKLTTVRDELDENVSQLGFNF